MNVSYKWLKEYVDFDLTPGQTADALTSVGLEVDAMEEVQSIKGGLEGIVVGEVLTCEPHPNSDHMHVCTVDLGGAKEQIVCGAPNVAAGEKVMVATLGTKLYDGDKEFTIKRSKLRGVESNGMICAEDEIGVGTSHDGIIVLPADTVAGTKAAAYYGLESDYVIEVDITPNHSDACSHAGVARDLYAWLRQNGHKEARLHFPSVERFSVDSHALPFSVEVEQREACPHYCAIAVRGCEVKESPKWLQDRLTAVGLRPINNIVDITNYVMMALGQPLHCFDADMVKGHKIVVKTLAEGTPFVTLDGVEHHLSERDLAICNAEEPMCIAGVFGGRGSGTYETTRDVIFESAYFHPTWIRKSARRHGLQTDASFRFERGIDPEMQVYALQYAAILARELSGGEIASDIVEVKDDSLPRAAEVRLDYQYCHDLVGKDIPVATMQSICRDLGMAILADDATGMTLRVPALRVDVTRPCDVVEEILRVYGYDNVEIPTQLKSSLTEKGPLDTSYRLQNLVAEQLVGCGFNEILNNSLTRTAYYTDMQAVCQADGLVRLINPLSQDLGVLRRTLLFGGLESISHNVNRRASDLRFFEYGNCYHFDAAKSQDKSGLTPSGETSRQILAAYSEEEHLGLWLTGKRVNGNWAHADEPTSVYELKAHVLNIFRRLGVPMGALVFGQTSDDIFASAQTISTRAGKVVAQYGLVSRRQTAKFGLEAAVYYADIRWAALLGTVKNRTVSYYDLPKFPAVSRDLALLLDRSTEFADIERIACQTEKRLLKKVQLFDVYEGKNIEEGKKSYAVNFILQDEQRTLNDKQIETVMTRLEQNLCKQLGAKVRGK